MDSYADLILGEDGYYHLSVNGSFYTDNPDITPYAYVTYYGNERYEGNNNYTGEMPVKADLAVEVTVNQSTTYINESVDIHIALVQNGTGKHQNGIVYVKVGNTTLTDANGREYFQVSSSDDLVIPYHNATAGIYDINVTYPGSGSWNPYVNDTESFEILRLPTETFVKVVNNTIGNIWIEMLVNDTRNDKIVHDGYLDIIYGGYHHLARVNTTGDTTFYKIEMNNPGDEILVTVNYVENKVYAFSKGIDNDTRETFTNITLGKQNATLTVEVNPNTSYIGDEVIISGYLINPLGNVEGKEIYLTINGTSNTERTVITDKNGHYKFVYDHDLSIFKGNGTFNVTVHCNGNESVNTVINSTNFTVNKIPTTTTISILNNTVGNVTVGVNVLTNITGRTSKAVENGTVEFYHNGEKIAEVTVTGAENVILLPITESGDYSITAKYLENDIYLSSDATLDDEAGTPFENITVSNQTATITVDATPDTVLVGETVNITGTLVDGMGLNVTGQKIVNITIDGVNYTVDVTEGRFHLENITYTHGIKPVIATFLGNQTVNPVSANTNFTVNLIPTKTLVSVVNSTVGNVSISVNVTNTTGEIVKTGELKVTVGETVYDLVPVNTETGETIIPLTTITEMGDITVTVEYQANRVYNSSIGIDASTVNGTEEGFTNITPTQHQTTLVVDVESSPVYIGQNATIIGTLYLDNGTAMNGTNLVTIRIGNIPVTVNVTDGMFTYNYTTNSVTPERLVTAVYAGNDDDINGSSDTTTFAVEKLPTSTHVDVLSNVIGNVTINVTVTDTFNNVNVTDMFNGVLIAPGSIIEVEYEGVVHNYTVSRSGSTIIKLDDIVAPRSNIDINVRYRENHVYQPSSDAEFDKITVVSQTPTLTINATPANSSVGDVVTVSGRLQDAFGNNIIGREIVVTINGTTLRNTTDNNGRYYVYYTSTRNGTFTAIANYNGNSTIAPMSNSTNFTVNKIPTNTSIALLNNTVGNVTINVTVVDNETNPITSGKFNVTIAETGQTFTVNIEGTSTVVNLNITKANATFHVKVDYLGDNKYINSTGMTSDELEELVINTVKQNATITITADPREVYVRRNVTITGTLYDGMNKPITGKINLTFVECSTGAEDVIEDVDVIDGRYSYVRLTHFTGEVNVTASYAGNETINACNATTNYTIDKIPTTTELTPLNITYGNFTVAVKVTDVETGFVINTGSNITFSHVAKNDDGEYEDIDCEHKFTIDLDRDTDKFTVDEFGRIIVKLSDDFLFEEHEIIRVVYDGNETYKASNATDEEDVLKDATKLTVKVNDTLIYINQTVEVTVNLTDAQGNPLAGKINLTIGNITREVTIGDTGIYTVVTDVFDTNFNTNTSGKYNVTANYTGTPTRAAAVANDSFTVEKIPTQTIVQIVNNTYGNVSIDVVVNDTVYDKVITNGTIRIVINGREQPLVELNGTKTNIPLNVETTGNVNVEVYFLEDDTYKQSRAKNNDTLEELDIIDVIPQTANLTVVATPNATYVGETINITGQLVDGLGNNISNVRIFLDVGGTVYDNVFTNSTGGYSIEHPTVREGEYTVVADYRGNSTVNSIIATTTYTVSKINTTTTVTVLNNTVGNVTIGVNVTDNLHNTPITNGYFNITIENNETEIKTITGQETIVKIDVDTNGTIHVNVSYMGDDKYNPSNATTGEFIEGQPVPFTNITTEKQNVTLNVNVVRDTIDVGTYVFIQGTLTNATGDGIGGATITLTFNGLEPTNVTTRANGAYNLTRLVHIPGEVEVVAYYNGSEKYNNATDDTHYVARRLPTNTTVTIANNTVGNVSIDVSVVDKFHELPITVGEGLLNVTVNNVSTLYNITGAVTNIKLVNITNTTTANVTVTYIGNDTYMPSTGYDADQLNKFTEITADKQNATITLEVNPTEQHILEDVTFSGELFDGMGNNIKGVNVNITITQGETTITEQTPIYSNGMYSYPRHTNMTGEMTVTVSWAGNETVNPVNITKTYTVKQRPTTTTVTVTNDTVGNTSIAVQVIDTRNPSVIITNGTLTINLNGKPFKENITGETTNIKLNTTYAGYYEVVVVYDGNYTYETSTGNITNITTTTQNAQMTISNNANDARVGDIVMINGTLKDGLGKAMGDRRITVNVNGTGLTTRTDDEGNYVVYYTTTSQGNFTAVATFTAAAGVVGTMSVNTTFEVLRLNTTTVVKVANNTAGNVTIDVNVTDERGRPVTSGSVNVSVEDQETIPVTINGEPVLVKLDIETNGTFDVNVTYLGNEQYNPSNGTTGDFVEGQPVPFTNITTVKQDVNLTVGTIRPSAPVTTGMIISGILLNASNEPIKDANITLTFNGEDAVVVRTDANGHYVYDRVIRIPDDVTVMAYYNGSEKYNNATANTSYIGEKLPTNTTVTIANNTVGNVSIDVVVIDKFHHDLPITDGTINVTVNNVTTQHNITGVITNIKLDITNTTKANVTVTYTGNYTYLPSTGYDADQVNKFTQITADKQNATLTIEEGPSPVYVFNNITYNGTLVDGLGNNITGKINITVMYGDELVQFIEDVDVINGYYEYNRTSIKVGEINVTATYLGNETINPTNASTTYVINKRPTTTLVTLVNDTMGNLVIDVEVKDALNGSHITTGGELISLSILEGTYTYEITGDVTRITVPVTQNRKLVAITVRYLGNDTYQASTGYNNATYEDTPEIFNNITAKLHNTTLSINVNPVNSSVGTVYNISGNFVDANGTAIVGEDLVIKVNGTRFDVTTVEDGYYSVNYTSYKEGNFTAEVEFMGNDLINKQTNSTTFLVNKIPTTTIVSIINNTVGNVQVAVNVIDNETHPITTGDLEVTVDGHTYTEKIRGATTTLDLDITTTDKVNVTIKYLGNDTYMESVGLDARTLEGVEPEEFNDITADKDAAQIEVEVIYDERFVGEKQNIIVYLNDMNDEPIRGPVNITITNEDGTVIFNETRTTNRAGIVRLTISNATAGNIKVNASFESEKYNYTDDQGEYVVNKLPTSTTVDILSNVKGNVSISVRVVDTENNVPITEGNLTLTVDGETKNVPITGKDTVLLINSIADNIQVSVKYPGNETYLNSTGKTRDGEELTNITTVNTTVLITINADRPDIYIGEYITINGRVTLADGVTLVTEGYVIVRLDNGTEIRYSTVDEYLNGINNQYLQAGTYKANATYYTPEGVAKVTSNNLTLTVNKIPTITTVEILNNTNGNVTIDVVVRENVTDKYTATITEGVINVTIDGQTVQYPIRGANTTIKLDQITTSGKIEVDVVYNGTDKYLNSTARDKDNIDTEFTEIDVSKIPTITNVEIINTTLTNVIIGVNVTNATGELVTTGGVVVYNKNGSVLVSETALTEGRVDITIPASEAGTIEIRVEYQENDVYLASNATNSSAIGTPEENITVINVTKIPTKTTVEVLDNVLGNVTIGVKVTNMTDETVTKGTVVVKDLNGNVITSKDLTNGEATIAIAVDEAGKLLVVVEYQENDIYLASNATNSSAIGTPYENVTIIDVSKIPTNTTVDVLNTTLGNVTIGVTVTNKTGELVTEGIVVVKDETGKGIISGILTDGKVNITIPSTTPGELKVIVEYQENTKYLASNATDSTKIGQPDENITVINVTKIPTITNVEVLDTTLGNVSIKVNVTNSTGDLVTKGEVIVYNKDGTVLVEATALENGVQTISIPTTKVGNLEVRIEYQENDVYLGSNATDSSKVGQPDENITVINVTKIPTKTTVEVLNNTAGNVTIGVTVTNMTDDKVTKGTVAVFDEAGNELTRESLTNGVANIIIPVSNDDTLKVIVTYLENEIYLASNATNSSAIGTPEENITVIDVTKQDSTLTVDVTPETPVIGDTVVINGTLVDEDNNPIADANITVTINGDVYNTTTNDKGEYEVTNVTTTAGTKDVIVHYPGNDTVNPTTETTSFNVDKIPTSTVVQIVNTTVNNVTMDIAVTDKDAKPVTSGQLEVTVNGKTTTVDVTGETTRVSLDAQLVGTVPVSVKYVENDIYAESTGVDNDTIPTGGKPEDGTPLENITTQAIKSQLTANATPQTARIGDSITITGKLTDETGKAIPDAYVEVKVGDTTTILTTDSNGEYTTSYIAQTKGTENVSVTYKGNSTVNGSTAKASFEVDKIPTTTLVSIENTTVGNVQINVEVIDDTGKAVTSGELEISLPDQTITVNVTDSITTVNLPITTTGVVNVEVEYLENDVYYNSTGLDKDSYTADPENPEPFNNITVTKLNTTITVDTTSPVKANSSINITGRLVDENNRPINGATVVVNVDKNMFPVTTNDNGEYTLVYNGTIVGTHNVTSRYEGNNTFSGSQAKTTFDVEKLTTSLTLDDIEDVTVGQEVNITGKLVDEDGNPISDAEITVSLGDKNQTVTTDKDGQYTAPFTVDTVGTIPVTVDFTGNEQYESAQAEDTINVVKQEAIINVEVPTNSTPINPGNITGNVTDEEGNPIPNLPVNVTVNNETIPTTTDENGTFTVPIDDVVPGVNNVTVTAGNETVEADPVDDKFVTSKVDTTITLDPVKDTTIPDEVEITGKLVDETGKALPNAKVDITFDGTTKTVTTDKDGNYRATFPTESEGPKLVKAEYLGDETYNGAHESSIANVEKIKANIDVTLPENSTPNHPGNITGNVTDEEGNPIPNLPVNVTVNNETIPTTTDENGTFTVPIDDVVPGVNNVTVTAGNETVEADPVVDKIIAGKDDVTLTIDPVEDTPVGTDVNITGKLVDDEGNPIPEAPITVTVGNNTQTVITDDEGNYVATVPTDTVGTIPVTVEYPGNDKYNPAKAEDTLNVEKVKANIEVEVPENSTPNHPGNITGKVTDEEGNPLPGVPVNVTVNNKTYPVITDENGTFTVPIDDVVPGVNNVTVTVDDNKTDVEPVEDKFNADKDDAILTVDPVEATHMGETPVISGRLTDKDGNPISEAELTVTVNGETYTVKTDKDGKYKLPVNDTTVGLNNVTVKFTDKNYKPATANTSFELSKVKTKVVVDSVEGTVGEDITLVAHVYDENGNPVTGGNLVFKLNGRTLRTDGRFDTDVADPWKFKVVNGIVTFTMKADLYLRAGKNITASYSGSYMYESAKGNVAEANIRKRTAQVQVTVIPTKAKQDTDIVFTAKLRDVTKNATNTTCLTTNATLLFKINGVSLKDSNGKAEWLPVTDSVVNYVYHVPTGMGGVDEKGIKNYTVEAVYNNIMFYPDVRNSSDFHVQRSIVNINFESTTVKNNVLSVKASFTDYENEYLIGDNKICVKINGKTYQENGKTKYFTVHNGKVDLTGIKLSAGTKVKSVMLVTGDRQAYLSARATTTDIVTS